MFETLEPPQQLTPRPLPLLFYGTYGLVGLVFVLLGVHRHGFSQPFRLAIGAVMLILSLVWFVMTLRSKSPLPSRRFNVQMLVLLALLMAHDIPSI